MTIHFVVWVATSWIALCLLSDVFARWYMRQQCGMPLGPISLSGFLYLPVVTVPFLLLEVVPAYLRVRRWRRRIRSELQEMRREAASILSRLDGRTGPDIDAARVFLTKAIAEMDRRLRAVS